MCLYLSVIYGWFFGSCNYHKKETSEKVVGHQSRPYGATNNYENNLKNRSLLIGADDDFKSKLKQENMSSSNDNKQQTQQPSATTTTTTTNSAHNPEHSNESMTFKNESADDMSKTQSVVTPSLSSSSSSRSFQIRTLDRRHLDFDDIYDLNEVDATSRSKWSGSFHFIQAADSQFGMIDSYIYKRTKPGWQEEIKLCEDLVAKCNRMEPRPKFMIICGDLVDARPFHPSTETRLQQIVDFKRIFAKLDPNIPLVCVCGNHDIGDEPTMDSVQDYRQTYGDDYFYFTKNDVLFIVINSQFYQNREFVEDYASKQDEWLESMLTKCKLFKYSIVFEHIPWFLKHFDEEDDYFNIKREVRLKWLRKFKDAGVTKIFCGHYHRNAGGWYENMELVVTSAIGAQCGNDKSGIRIVKVLEKSIEHQYYAMEDIPLEIKLP